MGTKGQSSDFGGPGYHSQGLPLEPGVVEVITSDTAASGGRHELIWDFYTNAYVDGVFHEGEVVVYSWPAEHPSNQPLLSLRC